PPALLTAVQGVPADLGRRHQFQIQSPESHGHYSEHHQQPEAPPQQLDRAQKQQQRQRGARAPHGAAPTRATRYPAPAGRPGPSQSRTSVMIPGCLPRARSGGRRLTVLAPAAEPGSSSPSVRTPLHASPLYSPIHPAPEELLGAPQPPRSSPVPPPLTPAPWVPPPRG
uniref:Uncharacterized protein n=1 Tax=Nannospalax galili TaxID=1026970 RepID=A0A8C6S2R8_NANGA